MKKKLILYNFIITFIAIATMFVLGLVVTQNNSYSQAQKYVSSLAKIYSDDYKQNGTIKINVVDGSRVSIIDSSGKVISDSAEVDTPSLENHLNREEILSALAGEPKVSVRKSGSVGYKMMYYALKVDVDNDYVFVRVAIPVKGLNEYVLGTLPAMFLIMVLAISMSIAISVFFSNKALKPLEGVKIALASINEGNYVTTMPLSNDDNINKMLIDINDLSGKLQKNILNTANQQAKLDYIIDNITDAIIVLDKENNIQLLNTNAIKMFGVTKQIIGQDIYSLVSDKQLLDRLSNCEESGYNSTFEWSLNKVDYLCAVRDCDNYLTIIVMSDITVSKNNARLRGEFFDNASHELKTPLTSIIGFNDMLSLSPKDEAQSKYIQQIDKESHRMLALIDDMLNLSSLENNSIINKEKLQVSNIAKDVIQSLDSIAQIKQVAVEINGTATVYAEQKHIYELVKNLVENAIKYNKEGGKVIINLSETKRNATIEVKDSGIGIDKVHQTRVFERFYRVQKSRSRETGGTGLGLAIVKHICELYNAHLTLTSKSSAGTTVKVVFDIFK